MKVGILEPDHFSELGIRKLKKLGVVCLYNEKNNLELFLKETDILFIRLKYQINKSFIDKCENLKILCSPTTGLNHIDLDYLNKKNINLISLKDKTKKLSKIRATPENTLGLGLALIRGYSKVFLNSQNSEWDRYKYYGDELQDMKVGIIGFGRVGKQLSKYLKVFSSKIYTYDIKNVKTKKNITVLENIDELINKCQMVFMTASYSNNIILNKHHIDSLKNKYFINTSRGELINEEYLIKKINSNHFKGVAIDVISGENLSNNNLKYFLETTKKHNVIITPHISGVTIKSLNKTEEILINSLFECL